MISTLHDDLTDQRDGYRWDDYRKEDLLWSRQKAYRRKVTKSIGIIEDWLARCRRPYIAFSGGKDSVCVLALVQRFLLDSGNQPLVTLWHDSGVEWPGVPLIIDRLKKSLIIKEMLRITPHADVLGLKKMQAAGLISAAQKDNLALFGPVAEAVQAHNFDGAALGLRKEESKGRRLDGVIHGSIYENKHGFVRCTPISDWNYNDVFAFIASNRLPLHPIYSAPLLHLENRGRIRLSWWLSTDNYRHGEVSWVRHNYPQIYSAMVEVLPEVQHYV